MIDRQAWMIRNKRNGHWASWRDWIPDSANGGSIWFIQEEAQRYVDNLNAGTIIHGIEAELVPLRITDGTGTGS